MVNGTLENQNQSSSLEIEIDDQAEQKLEESSDGESIEIEVTTVRGYASSPDIYVAPYFKSLSVRGISYQVEILSEFPQSRVIKPGTKIKVKVTFRVEFGRSAFFQK